MLTTIVPHLSKGGSSKVENTKSADFMRKASAGITSLFEMEVRSAEAVDAPGVEFLATILRMADTPYYRRFTDNITRYGRIEKDLAMYQSMELWIENGIATSPAIDVLNLILPTNQTLDIDKLPSESASLSELVALRPLRMIDAPCNELSLYVDRGKMLYSYSPPMVATYMVDVPMLILAYCRALDIMEERNAVLDERDFVKKVCIPGLLYDSFIAWNLETINLYSMFVALDENSLPEPDLMPINSLGNDVFREKELKTHHEDIIQTLVSVSRGSITPAQATRSLYVSEGLTLADYAKEFDLLNNPLIRGEHTLWQRIASELWVKRCILSVYSLNPSSPSTKALWKDLRRTLRRLKRVKFDQHLKYPAGKEYVKNQFNDIYSMIV